MVTEGSNAYDIPCVKIMELLAMEETLNAFLRSFVNSPKQIHWGRAALVYTCWFLNLLRAFSPLTIKTRLQMDPPLLPVHSNSQHPLDLLPVIENHFHLPHFTGIFSVK